MRISPKTESVIIEATGSHHLKNIDIIQNLWSNYGQLLRIHLEGGNYKSVILKHIKIPETDVHPKGFNTDLSRQRKIKSYQVETTFYEKFNSVDAANGTLATAKCLASSQDGLESLILLEDLDALGFERRLNAVDFEQVEVVLDWLASFHAKFMHVKPEGLWQSGTYWHIETRPDELEVLANEDRDLKNVAHFIDERLKGTQCQTLVHGDAKLANFCFSSDLKKVAAVDFQYVGGGCGMKDVAYFIGSCLDENESEVEETRILDFYFDRLRSYFRGNNTEFSQLENEWRELYHFAWADFHRFLKGWSPGHWKINTYSEKVSHRVQENIREDLISCAETAAINAGKLARSYWQKEFKVSSKEGHSKAASIVTEVDLLSQEKILETLRANIEKYNLGLLTEEENDDGSRFTKEHFWCIDPIDGTLAFSEGKSGFAVSIALVDRSGKTLLGFVYDPVEENSYFAFRGHGSFKNDARLSFKEAKSADDSKTKLFSDPSLKKAEKYAALETKYEIQSEGGAVMKIMNLINDGNALYFKYPKKEKGGCAIWDLAAAQLILEQAGGVIRDIQGEELTFNNPETVNFNHCGFIASSNNKVYEEALKTI